MRQVALASFLFFTEALAQTWCGKHYMSTQSIIAPGGNFPLPTPSSDPLLALWCAPAIRPYLAEDVGLPAAILIDMPVVYYEIANAQPIQLCDDDAVLDVMVSLDGRTLTTGSVPLNVTAYELPFSLEGITPRKAAYNLSCKATYTATSQSFSATTPLYVLPNPTKGSVTKMDLRTGALLAKPATGLSGPYEPVFPIGFYTTFDGYLASNLSLIDELKEQGFTIIHPLPLYDNLTVLNLVLDRMQQVGLYLMWEMYNWRNATSLAAQVDAIKSWPNLLLWYTADEPDGQSEPLNATMTIYDLVYALDGYHPVSLVLNCKDYFWSPYAAGADVIMQDAYMVGNNVSWSNEWDTPCTPDYGDCGCDDCASIAAGDTAAVPPNSTYYDRPPGDVPANSSIRSFFNVADRVESFRNWLEVVGWEHSKAVWTVPQAFGRGNDYWLRVPTGHEWVVQTIMGINQGVLGVVSWNDPTTADIKAAASALARSLPTMTPYMFNPLAVRRAYIVGGASVATWRATGGKTLMLATNANYVEQRVGWEVLGLIGVGVEMVRTVFRSGVVEKVRGGFVLGPVGSGAFVVDV